MPPDLLSQKFMRVVPRVMRAVRQEMRRNFAGIFTVPQMRILVHLDHGPLANKDLAEIQGVSVPAMSRMVDHLVKKGLIKRTGDAKDRRVVRLSLNPSGRKLLAKHRRGVQRLFDARVEPLDPADRKALSQGLSLLEQIFPALKDTHASH